MLAITLAMLVIIAVVAGIVGIVVVGLEGRGSDRAPRLAETMARAGRHLNGDGEPPQRLHRLFG